MLPRKPQITLETVIYSKLVLKKKSLNFRWEGRKAESNSHAVTLRYGCARYLLEPNAKSKLMNLAGI